MKEQFLPWVITAVSVLALVVTLTSRDGEHGKSLAWQQGAAVAHSHSESEIAELKQALSEERQLREAAEERLEQLKTSP
jgi:hypothetical protein